MNEEIPSRRGVLRGALAVGCSLWVPVVLSGCDARKGANSDSSTTAVPAATGKASQVSVLYQMQPKGEQKCSGCANFIAGLNTCKVVDGQVSLEGWCKLWAKKA